MPGQVSSRLRDIRVLRDRRGVSDERDLPDTPPPGSERGVSAARVAVLVVALAMAPSLAALAETTLPRAASASPNRPAAFLAHFAPDGDGPLYPAHADGRRHDRPQINAARLATGEEIVIDGRLDDAVWARAETGFGFLQHEPQRRGEATVPTVFKVAYDDRALYFAFACWEDDMSLVARRLSRRDTIESSDFISIYLDPYLDRLTGYNFRINADGVKVDHYMFDDGDRDPDWDAVWQAETTEDERGWYLEVRIPLQALRFRPAASMVWGLQIYRWMHGRGEDTGWATWDRNDSGFVSRWGTLAGLDGITSRRALEVLPYVAGGLTDESNPAERNEALTRYLNWGADFKYNLTGALTAQATFQPDFGQVEADPAFLNLSPFETSYEEKRPFFVEGARFFTHPEFNLFYSRRIGADQSGSRIRAAGKLTGKLGGRWTVAALGAYTDVTAPDRIHNPLRRGEQETGYAVVRLARDMAGGNHRVGLMGTGVWRRDAGRPEPSLPDDHQERRDAYSGGVDWEFNLLDKAWGIDGSAVGTVVDPHPIAADPTITHDPIYGTAGSLNLRKKAGKIRAALQGTWESDRFDPNDIGFLQANDEITSRAWLQYRYDAEGNRSLFKTSYQYLQIYRSWFYGEQTRAAAGGAGDAWRHGRGHHQTTYLYFDSYNQTHDFQELGLSIERGFTGTSKHNTRRFDGRPGPLMTTAAYVWAFAQVQSDWRRDVVHALQFNGAINEFDSREWSLTYTLRWNAGRHLILRLSANYQDREEDDHWLTNRADSEVGIDGVAYVFGRLDQQVLDATLRAGWLPNRDTSLELYLQPYLTAGRYADPRYLARADSRDLRPYDLDARAFDFTYAALNLNLVYRWEYRPGSTLYVVWSHGRMSFDRRNGQAEPDHFDSSLRPGLWFDQEPRNTVLVKASYWFSL